MKASLDRLRIPRTLPCPARPVGPILLAALAVVAAVLAGQVLPFLTLPGGRPVLLPVTAPPSGSFPVRYLPDPPEGPPVQASAAVLLEVSTGTILYARHEHQRRAPASTTKIVTALLALESGRLQDVVTVSRRAAGTPGSSADLAPEERYTLEELLYGLMLPSGNDAAVAIAEHLAGDTRRFAEWMTRRARELGAYDSRFENPHGLDSPGHYSTAYDLALFARTAMQYPTFARMVGQRAFSALSRQKSWHNTNRLLWSFEGATGVKTGTTGRAGNCLVAAASRQGMQLISVVLDSPDRWADSARLLEYGFGAFAVVELARRGETVAEWSPWGGRGPTVYAMAANRLAIVVPVRAVKDVRGVVRWRLPAGGRGYRAGDLVGQLEGQLAGRPFGQVPLVAAAAAPAPPWWRR